MNKNRLLARCAMALAITVPCVFAQGATNSPDDLIPLSPRPFIESGMKRDAVVQMLGQPCARLSPDAWVYFNFQPRERREANVHLERPRTLDTALVLFENDRVIQIRLCDSKPVRAYIATVNSKARPEPLIAARPPPALPNPSRLP
jgi:hypothetical protein